MLQKRLGRQFCKAESTDLNVFLYKYVEILNLTETAMFGPALCVYQDLCKICVSWSLSFRLKQVLSSLGMVSALSLFCCKHTDKSHIRTFCWIERNERFCASPASSETATVAHDALACASIWWWCSSTREGLLLLQTTCSLSFYTRQGQPKI